MDLVGPLYSASVQSLSTTSPVLVDNGANKLLKTGRAFASNVMPARKLTAGVLSFQSSSQQGRVVPAVSNTANTAPQHPTWEANGAIVASCAEYAFEDSYDTSRFIEAAESCGSNAECVYQLAQLTATPGLNRTLLKKNGKQMAFQILPVPTPMTLLQNVGTFSLATTSAAPTASTASPSSSALLNAAVGVTQAQVASLATTPPSAFSQPKNAFFAYDLTFLRSVPRYASDAAFRAKAEAIITRAANTPSYNATSKFAWDKTMHDAYKPLNVSPAEAQDIKLRLRRYSDASDSYNLAKFVIPLLQAVIPGQSSPAKEQSQALLNSYIASRDAAIALRVSSLLGEYDHLSIIDGVSADQGCLSPTSIKCDWDPTDFVAYYTHVNTRAREAEFTRCIDATGDDFSKVPAASKLDSDTFTTWLDASDVPKLPNNKIGQRASDADQFGDPSLFAAGYSYDAGWALAAERDSNGTICKVKGNAYAKATASAWAFGNELKVLDTDTHVSAREKSDNSIELHSHLRVLGNDVYDPIHDSRTLETPPPYDQSLDKTLAQTKYTKWLWIGPVAVKLQVAAELKAGIRLHLAAEAASGCNAKNLAYNATASATPWLKAHATPEVSVGVVLIQGGVRGDIDLLAASVPVSAGASLAGDATKPNNVVLKLNMDADFVLDALKGNMSVFLEACVPLGPCTDLASKQIYSWDGYSYRLPLIDYKKDLSLPVFDIATKPALSVSQIALGNAVNAVSLR